MFQFQLSDCRDRILEGQSPGFGASIVRVESSNQDPLERLLDDQSDDDFGTPNLSKIVSHKTKLSEWTAQDFATIYTRFYPHLIRHCKRYLSNQSQVEEVVQEAFLYLMTSLPEIDTTEGVLRFLKWKTRFLALDVLRSKAAKSELSALPEELEIENYEAGFEDVERAEDAAVIQLALGKLSPRQRDVLLKSTYEELSMEDIGKAIGLKPNAVRQLLYRARAAFKEALVGEAELAGKSASEILGVAVKKAAKELRENAVRTSLLLVFLGLGAGLLNSQFLADNAATTIRANVPALSESNVEPRLPSEETMSKTKEVNASPTPTDLSDMEISQTADVVAVTTASFGDASSPDPGRSEKVGSKEALTQPTADFSTPLSTVVYQAGIYSDSYSLKFSDLFDGKSLEVFGGTGISAFLDFKLGNGPTIEQVVFQVRDSNGRLYYGLPEEFSVSTNENLLTVTATRIHLVDVNNTVMQDSPFLEKTAELILQLDPQSSPASASMFIR